MLGVGLVRPGVQARDDVAEPPRLVLQGAAAARAATPRPRASGATNMRLISQARSSRRLTPPQATGRPSAAKPTRKEPPGGASCSGVAVGAPGTSMRP